MDEKLKWLNGTNNALWQSFNKGEPSACDASDSDQPDIEDGSTSSKVE